MYTDVFERANYDVWDQNLLAYMDVIRRYRSTGGAIPDEKVLEIYDHIIQIIEHKKELGVDESKLEKIKDNVYRLLANIINIDCDFIENKMGPSLRQNPQDLGLAKNIFRFAFAGKCLDIPIFLEAVKIIFEKEPNFGMAKLIADRSYINKDYETALLFYEKAMNLTEENLAISELYLNQASINSLQGHKSKARQLALKALEADPGNKDAYNTIGNLYYNSYQECKKGVNEVEDRAVFFAAYDMYKRAGNMEGMKQSKEQFPLMEIIHMYNMAPGDQVHIGCWINESYTVQRRD
jgi:tetratricopeptide (TPR) repeat protein